MCLDPQAEYNVSARLQMPNIFRKGSSILYVDVGTWLSKRLTKPTDVFRAR